MAHGVEIEVSMARRTQTLVRRQLRSTIAIRAPGGTRLRVLGVAQALVLAPSRCTAKQLVVSMGLTVFMPVQSWRFAIVMVIRCREMKVRPVDESSSVKVYVFLMMSARTRHPLRSSVPPVSCHHFRIYHSVTRLRYTN